MTQGHGGEICASVWSRLVWGSGGGGRWDFRFFGFGYFLGRFFGFCNKNKKTSVFRFCCPLWFPVFPFFSIWFLVFCQKQPGFSDFGDRCGFRFFQFGRNVKDKPARAPNVVFVIVSHYQLPSSYNFALTSMSFLIWSEVPKIVFSRGWFSILDSSLPSASFKILYRWVIPERQY